MITDRGYNKEDTHVSIEESEGGTHLEFNSLGFSQCRLVKVANFEETNFGSTTKYGSPLGLQGSYGEAIRVDWPCDFLVDRFSQAVDDTMGVGQMLLVDWSILFVGFLGATTEVP